MTLATEAADISRVNELLARARTALLAVREALEITTRLSETLRGIAAVEDPAREAQACEDCVSRPARRSRRV